MPATGRKIRFDAELGWWLGSGLTVAVIYAAARPQPPFSGYSLWLEGFSVWLQLAVGPAMLLALCRRLRSRREARAGRRGSEGPGRRDHHP